MSEISAALLADPKVGITLAELKTELNELARIRHNARIAFCKRLAVAYMLIVGRPCNRSGPKDGAQKPFYDWCEVNLRSANGKTYNVGTLRCYLRVGFSSNPARQLDRLRDETNRRTEAHRSLGNRVKEAVVTSNPPKPVSVTKLRREHNLPTNVAQEVNQLMHAWEQASPTARAQFIYMVTGKRLAA